MPQDSRASINKYNFSHVTVLKHPKLRLYIEGWQYLNVLVLVDRRPIFDISNHRANTSRLFDQKFRPRTAGFRWRVKRGTTAAASWPYLGPTTWITLSAFAVTLSRAVFVLGQGPVGRSGYRAVVVAGHLQCKNLKLEVCSYLYNYAWYTIVFDGISH